MRSIGRLAWQAVCCGLALLLASTALASANDEAVPAMRTADLAGLDWIANEEVREGHIPGAVILVGHGGRVLYRRAFGERQSSERMTADTLFDLASLTKVIATTTAILQLAERGKLRLDEPAARYWPAFGQRGKNRITVRELLTHTSGLPAGLDLRGAWRGRAQAVQRIEAVRLVSVPGSTYLYSDLNFEVLGELVRRVSHLPLDVYGARYIFGPLGMRDTRFRPPTELKSRAAPTDFRNGQLLQGDVQDPTAARMDGVSGHAGLFSTADDLARFAQMVLDEGTGAADTGFARILRPETVRLMQTPQSPARTLRARGLGWDLTAPFAANRDELPPLGAIGHTGFTGTSLSIDPITQTYIIVLTNRLHSRNGGDVSALRAVSARVLAAALDPLTPGRIAERDSRMASYLDELGALRARSDGTVRTGLDVLEAMHFAPLQGLRVGLITHAASRDSAGRRTIDVLREAERLQLVALFSPEHGIDGTADERVPDGVDRGSGLPIYSLYGNTRRPSDTMLANLDALVFDLQDAGVRFYTYATTMAYAMERAAAKGLRFIVLDRPNPLRADILQGPLLDPDLRSFTGYFPVPLRHGMTIGELARLFNAENHIGARLEVITMRNYLRRAWYDETGLIWNPPSPNLRTLTQAALYPAIAVIEGTRVSVGRGTPTPFEVLGAPWIDADELAATLGRRDIRGVRFVPVHFIPSASVNRGAVCHGVRVVLVDRDRFNAGVLGIELASALHALYPTHFDIEATLGLLGSRAALQAIRNGEPAPQIEARSAAALDAFRTLRDRYLLYR